MVKKYIITKEGDINHVPEGEIIISNEFDMKLKEYINSDINFTFCPAYTKDKDGNIEIISISFCLKPN